MNVVNMNTLLHTTETHTEREQNKQAAHKLFTIHGGNLEHLKITT